MIHLSIAFFSATVISTTTYNKRTTSFIITVHRWMSLRNRMTPSSSHFDFLLLLTSCICSLSSCICALASCICSYGLCNIYPYMEYVLHVLIKKLTNANLFLNTRIKIVIRHKHSYSRSRLLTSRHIA